MESVGLAIISSMSIQTDSPKVGHCWECGYSLRGLESRRCPECGRGFDPGDLATMDMDHDVGPAARRRMRPPGWPMFSLIGLAVVLSLWAAATPMPSGMITVVIERLIRGIGEEGVWAVVKHYESPEVRYLYAFVPWILVGVIWIVRRSARGITVRKLSGTKAATFAYWRRWLLPHFILAATILFCMTPGPVTMGLWMSKGAVENELNKESIASANGYWRFNRNRLPGVNWVGIYPVDSARVNSRGYEYGGAIRCSNWGGFIYSPKRRPEMDSARQIEIHALGGDWYMFGDPSH